MYGVLGGMGPLAGADLMRRIIERTPAGIDQDHIPLMVYSAPQIPERSAAILGAGASPLPALARGVNVLTTAGAREIAIACCTAHHWHADLAATTKAHLLHVGDAVAASLATRRHRPRCIGLLATAGALASGFFQARLAAAGDGLVLPTPGELSGLFDPGVAHVKNGRLAEGKALLQVALGRLLDRNADVVVLGCSELSLVLRDDAHCTLDAMDALAALCVARWHGVGDADLPPIASASVQAGVDAGDVPDGSPRGGAQQGVRRCRG